MLKLLESHINLCQDAQAAGTTCPLSRGEGTHDTENLVLETIYHDQQDLKQLVNTRSVNVLNALLRERSRDSEK
jgi:hypothetical protein